MGKAQGAVATDEPVVDEPQKTEEGANTSLVLLPPWAIEVANRWRKHNFNDLRLKFDTGFAINREYGPTTVRQQHGLGTLRLLAAAIGTDPAELSRMRHFAESADSFELFRAKHPDCTSWNDVKSLLAGKSVGKERKLVEALIGRLQTAAADLKKPEFALDDVDLDRLLLELRTLGRELASRTGIRLTVASVPTEAAA